MPPKKAKTSKTGANGRFVKTANDTDSATGQFLTHNAKSGRVKSTTVVAGPDPMSPKDCGRIVKASVDSAGRILVPVKLRKALDIEPGDEVNLILKDGVLEIRSLDNAVREAQTLVRKYVPKNKSLVDELIADRRDEVPRE